MFFKQTKKLVIFITQRLTEAFINLINMKIILKINTTNMGTDTFDMNNIIEH